MFWQDEPLIEWVKRNPPSWSNQIIKNWEDIFPHNGELNTHLFLLKSEAKRQAIDMRTVIGQWDHYAGQTWIDALLKPNYKPGKIKNTVHLFDTNANYYFNEEKKEIYFDSVNGKHWYSHGGGNHRTVIAKFGFAMAQEKTKCSKLLEGVFTTNYTVDWKTFNFYKELTKCIKENDLDILFSFERFRKNEIRKENCHIETFHTIFHVADYRYKFNGGLHSHITASQFCQFAEWVIESRGELTRLDKMRHLFQFLFGNNKNGLLYPNSGKTKRIPFEEIARLRNSQ